MAITDGGSLPVAVLVSSASPSEVTLVEATIDACYTRTTPHRLIGDKAYDSDPLDARLAKERRIALIAPHKVNRVRPKTQDGRVLRRYRRRWKIERFNAWLQNFRRVTVRWEYKLANYVGFVQLACLLILLRSI
jgi:transposase